MNRRNQIRAKVLAQVDYDPRTRCWVWQGSHSGNGRGGDYPRMTLNGQTVAVHRVMYTNEHGYIPGKKHIDHKCRNRMCVNPDHLELVTAKENYRRRDGVGCEHDFDPCKDACIKCGKSGQQLFEEEYV